MSDAHTFSDEDEPARRPRSLSIVTPAMWTDIRVELAKLGTKMDRLLELNEAVEDMEERVGSLERFRAEMHTWSKVLGIIFAIGLAVIGTGYFFK